MITVLRNWSWPYFFSSLAAWHRTVFGVAFLIIILATGWYGLVQSPGDTAVPVAPTAIHGGSVSGSICGSHGPVVSAYESEQVGPLYTVVCQDGVTLVTGQP